MKLFVRNISWDATVEDFKRWLKDSQGYEPTEVVVIRSGEDGRSRGFGFVTFATDAAGSEALRDLNGEEFMGRPLHAEVAVERERGQRPKHNGGSRGRRQRRGDSVVETFGWEGKDGRQPRDEWGD